MSGNERDGARGRREPFTHSPSLPLSPQSFDVELPGPIDVPASVGIFQRNGDDTIDRWDGSHLVRTAPAGGGMVAYVCAVAGTVERPALHVVVENPMHRAAIEAAVRSTFVAPPAQFADLLRSDSVIAHLNAIFSGVRPVLHHDLLAGIVRCITSQQVNLRWAVTTRRRLAESFGERHEVAGHYVYSLNPERLATADAIASGRLDLARLMEMPDDEVISELTSIRGIGLWTAEWILARTLGRPRVVAGDLGVRKAVGLHYLNMPLPAEQEVRASTRHWGPSAGVAQQLLLCALASRESVRERRITKQDPQDMEE